MENINLPDGIRKHIAGKRCDVSNTGMSGAYVLMYDDMVLKVQPKSVFTEKEITMHRWLEGRLPVPGIIAYEEYEGKSWLLMTRIKGKMACDGYFLDRPALLAEYLAQAVNMLWETDITSCPVTRGPDAELADARYRVENGLVDYDNAEAGTFGEGGFRDAEQLLLWLGNNKPSFDPVLSHGDFCLPNIFLTRDGVSGLIDLGSSGKGDRWRDLTLCHRSLKHNTNGRYGAVRQGFDPDILFSALGIEPDRDKMRWYLLLDELF